MPERPRVLLADDHTLLREAFQALLEPDFEVVAAVGDGRAAVKAVETTPVDVVILDVAMPDLNGLEAARQIKVHHPEVRIVFLTVDEDPDTVAEAFHAGASGYLPKSAAASDLFRTIQEVLDGEDHVTPLTAAGDRAPDGTLRRGAADLTPRQREVLQLLAEGRSMKEAAATLQIAPRTVAFHKYGLMRSFGLESNAELVQFAIKHHLIGG